MITHEQHIKNGLNRQPNASVERIDPSLLSDVKHYLFNIYSNEYSVNTGTTGLYVIPACPEGKEWHRAPQHVPGVVEDIYPHFTDKEEYRVRATPGMKIVDAVLKGSNPSEDITRFGVFSETTPKPSKEGLAAAKKLLVTELQRQMREADQLAASADPMERKSVDNDKFYRGARYLGVKKNWMSENSEMTLCPFCAVSVSPSASICHGCHQVINKGAFDAMQKQVAGVAA
jgi:hypothetical protein